MELNRCGCGGTAKIDYVHSASLDEPIYWYVQCTSCWCKVVGMTEERAVTAWNIAHPKAIRLDDVREMAENLSHELWATAQLLPHEGIVDGATRIEEVLIDRITAYVEGKNGRN